LRHHTHRFSACAAPNRQRFFGSFFQKRKPPFIAYALDNKPRH
jgi:hypothetical protein